jgi:hypothetical protein
LVYNSSAATAPYYHLSAERIECRPGRRCPRKRRFHTDARYNAYDLGRCESAADVAENVHRNHDENKFRFSMNVLELGRSVGLGRAGF